MRNLLLLLFAFLFILPASAQQTEEIEEEKTIHKNFFYQMPFRLFRSNLQLGYERDFANARNAIHVSAGVTLRRSQYNSDLFGYNGELHFRHTLFQTGKAARKSVHGKMYFSPYIQYQYYEQDENYYYGYPYYEDDLSYYYNSEIDAFGAGTLFGFRTLFFNKLALDVYLGGGVRYANYRSGNSGYGNGTIFGVGYTGAIPKGGFQLGFAF